MLKVWEEARYLGGPGQGLQRPGALWEHVLGVGEESLPGATHPGLWLSPAPLHELPLWASSHLWGQSFSEAILQKGNGGREGNGRGGTGAPKQGLTSEGVWGDCPPQASSTCKLRDPSQPEPLPSPHLQAPHSGTSCIPLPRETASHQSILCPARLCTRPA